MGRPDAAAEQLKWVVDFYMKYNQQKGAQEACEQIIELDPQNGMAYFLMGKLMPDRARSACRPCRTSNNQPGTS
jgi:hypothetical protein